MSTDTEDMEPVQKNTPRRGDIFWLALAEGARSGLPIPHPHVVVQEDIFNVSRIPTTIVCAMTSNLQRAHEPGNVLLDAGEGELERRSVVVVSQVSSVPKADLGFPIGKLSQERVDQIVAGLRFQQASFFRGR